MLDKSIEFHSIIMRHFVLWKGRCAKVSIDSLLNLLN